MYLLSKGIYHKHKHLNFSLQIILQWHFNLNFAYKILALGSFLGCRAKEHKFNTRWVKVGLQL